MIGITAATGHLGQLVVQALLARGVAAHDIVAIVRTPEKAAPLAAQGVQVRQADYARPDGWAQALAGVDRLLLVSGTEPERVSQHTMIAQAARTAGVKLLAYTSILKADTSPLLLAADHLASETAIRASGLPYTFLRNGWYTENYNPQQALQTGALLGAGGEGRFSPASRADYAAAAAAVLTGEGHENKVYELGGDQAVTLAEVAAEIGAQGGRPVVYQDMPADAYAQTLRSFGLPDALADMLADSDGGIRRGDLQTDRRDLQTLIGRPTTRLADAIAAQLGG